MALKLLPAAAALALVGIFVLCGLSVIPYAGIQNDEAPFSVSIYAPRLVLYKLVVFGRVIPLMVISYMGALKGWVYAPILWLWRPSVWSVRIPVLLAGAVAIWLFYRLLVRVAGPRGGLFGCALLATDTMFLLTTCFDWGPVALQQLLTVAGVFFLVKFHQEGRRGALGMGFFCFGLALWNKALFTWTLAAMIVAAAVALRPELRRALSRRTAAVAALAFALGAAPFLLYNLHRPLATFRTNAQFSLEGLDQDLRVIHRTLNGSGLMGYIVADSPAIWPRENLLPWLLALSLGSIPVLWKTPARRMAIFAVVLMGTVALQMMLTKNVGGGVHHAVLLWPWPHFLVAVALAEAGRRNAVIRHAATAAVVVACAWNLMLTSQYQGQFARDGGKRSWTDASGPLAALLERTPAQQVFVMDWGMMDNIRLLSEGRLPLRPGAGPLRSQPPGEADRREFRSMAEMPSSLFVSHTDAYEEFPGVNASLRAMAEQAGYRRELLALVRDSRGRAVFEVFRLRKDSSRATG